MKIDLRDLQVRYSTFHLSDSAPLLSQKDQLVCPEYPHHEKFLKLTLQEKTWGLLDDLKQFTNQYQWDKCLLDHCAELKGHRLVWKKDADPVKLKFLKAQARSRQRRLNILSQTLTDKGMN